MIYLAGIGVTIFLSIIGGVWYLGNQMGQVTDALTTIRTNDLHHLYERVGRIESLLMEGKQ